MPEPETVFFDLEKIYRMFSSAQEIAAENMPSSGKDNANADPKNPMSLIIKVQEMLIDASGGAYSADDLLKKLSELVSDSNPDQLKKNQQMLNRWLTVASSKGFLDFQSFPKTIFDNDQNETTIGFNQLTETTGPEADRQFTEQPLTFVQVRNKFISPAVRDAGKVETFLNFLPPIIVSQLIPYFDMEVVFDRPPDTEGYLSSPSILKFLLGGQSIDLTKSDDPNTIMYKARQGNTQITEREIDSRGDAEKLIDRSVTASGMELFTTPQTLLNYDSKNENRYVKVLDPTRPFATLENATIDVKATVGIMSHKTANISIKLHDRSRLSELADIIQPASYGRVTIWLTYGWRFPKSNKNIDPSGTYEEFINNNMLMREPYGIVNSTLNFDQSGQVGVTLSLFTKAILELKQASLVDDGDFAALRKQQLKLSKKIDQLRERLGIESPIGKAKDVRPYAVLGAAAVNAFPGLEKPEVDAAIAALEKALNSKKVQNEQEQNGGPKLSPKVVDDLIKTLREYYGKAGGKEFSYRKTAMNLATNIIQEKFTTLSTGADPFLVFSPEKEQQLLIKDMGFETGVATYPYLDNIKQYFTDSMVQLTRPPKGAKGSQPAVDAKKGKGNEEFKLPGFLKKDVVSFGKLFSVFMKPVIQSIDTIDECQVLFYNFNDYASKASGTNIAEFPIDVPEFLLRYREVVAENVTIDMSIESFIKLAIDSQIRDLRGIPYGFRFVKDLLTPWKFKDEAKIAEKKEAEFGMLSRAFNRGRGPFQLPEIEIFFEMAYKKSSDNDRGFDLLSRFKGANVISNPYGVKTERILRIHIYDRATDPYPEAGFILKSNIAAPPGAISFDEYYERFDPYHKGQKILNLKNELFYQNSANTIKDNIQNAITGGSLRKLTLNSSMGWEEVKKFVSQRVPTLIPGSNGSTISEAAMSSNSDATLSAIQMISMGKGNTSNSQPNGSGPNNMPLRVIPSQLSMKTLGIPVINFAQRFFVDMNTGTSIDNIYIVNSITHAFSPGKFDTSLTFAFYDAFGKFETVSTLEDMLEEIAEKARDLQDDSEGTVALNNGNKFKPDKTGEDRGDYRTGIEIENAIELAIPTQKTIDLVKAAAAAADADPYLLLAQWNQEGRLLANPTPKKARTNGGGVGPFQMLRDTATSKTAGLVVDPKRGIDERLDPEKAAYGAARLLKYWQNANSEINQDVISRSAKDAPEKYVKYGQTVKYMANLYRDRGIFED